LKIAKLRDAVWHGLEAVVAPQHLHMCANAPQKKPPFLSRPKETWGSGGRKR
jgi:hypothetical protein